jgi:flagellar basal body-associated protein FliL
MADNQVVSSNVPPSPPEVKIRTMKSDLESMAQSGGGAPQYKTIRAPSLVFEREEAEKKPIVGEEKAGKFWLIAVPIIALALLGIIAYFAYGFFLGAAPATQPSPATPAPAAQTPASQPPSTASIVPSVAQSHSIFKKPADQILTLMINKNVTSAADLQTFSQRLTALIGGANATATATSTFFEVDMKYSDGSGLALDDIFTLADIYVLPPQFFAAHFSPNATSFVYSAKGGSASGGKDKNGVWPGFVLSLKPTENWLFLQNEASELEKSSKINNFFLTQPGSPSPNGFADATVDGQPARILSFSAPGVSFVYSWSRGGYLIFSTSLDGLKSAFARLQ